VAVISLKDFNTTQIVRSDLIQQDHGAAFVTPNTEYVIEASQFATPLGDAYAKLDEYERQYRGAVIFWSFDREKGRINKEKSFAVEVPPYAQDLASSGKLASDGWVFINSWNTEEATGGTLEGKPAVESGPS